MTKITSFYYRGETFEIVTTESQGKTWYCAINRKDIDENGKLKKSLNGLQMHASETLQGCMNNTKLAIDVQIMSEQGMTTDEILATMI